MMDTDTDEDLLRRLAAGGTIDYDVWPRLLCTVVSQIEKICHNEFSIPLLPSPKPVFTAASTHSRHGGSSYGVDVVNGGSVPREISSSDIGLPSSSQDDAASNNKENTQPASNGHQASLEMSMPSLDANNGPSSPLSSAIVNGDNVNNVNGNSGEFISNNSRLPPQIVDLLEMIISTLTVNFAEYPPHTIQRLSELVLAPRQHYRNLAPYLHALLRIVNVTSGINIYPLPPAIPEISAMALLANGTDRGNSYFGVSATTITNNNNDDDNNDDDNNDDDNNDDNDSQSTAASLLGSDESLGGALLTPIPWLRRQSSSVNGGGNSSDDGENGTAANTIGSATNSDDGDDEIDNEDDNNGRSRPHSFLSGGHGSEDHVLDSDMSDGVSGPLSSEGTVGHGIIPHGTPILQRQQHEQQADSAGRGQPSQAQAQHLAQQQQQHTTHTHHSRSRIEGHVRTESTETIDGPNGVGSIETVSVSVNGIPSHGAMVAAVQLQQQQCGITQGELLRQEQTAGVVPVSQLARVMAVAAGGGGSVSSSSSNINSNSYSRSSQSFCEDEEEEEERAGESDDEGEGEDEGAHHGGTDMADAEGAESGDGGGGGNENSDNVDEVPHARGPQEIGLADTGPQREAQTADSARRNRSIVISRASDGTVVTVHGLDVEAAVGRKADTMPSRGMSAMTMETAAIVPVPKNVAAVTNAEVAAMAEFSFNQEVDITTTAAATGSTDDNDCDTASASAPPTPSKREAGDEPTEAAPTVKKRKDSKHDEDGGDGDGGDNNDSDNINNGMASAPSSKTFSPGA